MKTAEQIDEARGALADALNTWCAPASRSAPTLLAMAMVLNWIDGNDPREFSAIIERIREIQSAG